MTQEAFFPEPAPLPTVRRTVLADRLPAQVHDDLVHETVALLERRLATVQRIVDVAGQDVTLNPFLMLALAPAYNIYSPYEAAEFVQIAKLPHGDATAFGRFIEERILGPFGVTSPAEKRADPRLFSSIDREVTVEGQRYLMTLKAGPRTMNQSHANEMVAAFPRIHAATGLPIIIGITYGRAGRVNNKPALVRAQTGEYVHVLVGKYFWEFVTGVQDAHWRFYEAIREAQRVFARAHEGKTFYEHMMEARLRLAASFRETFGLVDVDVDMWERVFTNAF